MIQRGDPVAQTKVRLCIEGVPVRVMRRYPVQETDCVIIPVCKHMIFGGLQLRIGIGAGTIAGLLRLGAAEESGERIKAEAEIPERVPVLTALAALPAVSAAMAVVASLTERVSVSAVAGSIAVARRTVRIGGRISPGLFDLQGACISVVNFSAILSPGFRSGWYFFARLR